jgi:hypothetical protein
MLRKAIHCTLVLLLCALVVAVIDGARRASAMERMVRKGVGLGNWRYAVTHGAAPDPGDAKSEWQRRLRCMDSTPRTASLDDLMGSALDESVSRDLAIARVEELKVYHLVFATKVLEGLSGQSSIRELDVEDLNFTNEDLNCVWRCLTNLEGATLVFPDVGVEGFREIGKARKLKRLSVVSGLHLDERLLVQLREAPALEELSLEGVELTENSLPAIASMPTLLRLRLDRAEASRKLAAGLRQMKRPIAVSFIQLPIPGLEYPDTPQTAPAP